MRQAERKKEKDKVAIALMLAFCVIALTSIFTIKSNINKINDSNTNVPVSDQTKTEDIKGDETDDSAKASTNVPTVDSREGQQQQSSTSEFVKPVKADDAYVTNAYSMDSLIYSVTLDQYMVHCGVDIDCLLYTSVVSKEFYYNVETLPRAGVRNIFRYNFLHRNLV